MRDTRGATKVLGIALAAAVLETLLPRFAAACATCYGAAGSPMVDGMNKAILVLLGFVGLVYLGVGKIIWDFRKRAKKAERPSRASLRLIHGGKR